MLKTVYPPNNLLCRAINKGFKWNDKNQAIKTNYCLPLLNKYIFHVLHIQKHNMHHFTNLLTHIIIIIISTILHTNKHFNCTANQHVFVFFFTIVQFLFYLNQNFQASSIVLLLYRPVCVRPGGKPQRAVYSHPGSNLYH